MGRVGNLTQIDAAQTHVKNCSRFDTRFQTWNVSSRPKKGHCYATGEMEIGRAMVAWYKAHPAVTAAFPESHVQGPVDLWPIPTIVN